jgi:hypothetical protein
MLGQVGFPLLHFTRPFCYHLHVAWRWVGVGILGGLLIASSASAESEPPPPCTSPDGFPRGVRQDFPLAPSLPANAPGFPLMPAQAVPEPVSVVDDAGAALDAELIVDDRGWVLVQPDDVVESPSMVVAFEDACRVELETAPTSLERIFLIDEEADLPGDTRRRGAARVRHRRRMRDEACPAGRRPLARGVPSLARRPSRHLGSATDRRCARQPHLPGHHSRSPLRDVPRARAGGRRRSPGGDPICQPAVFH